MCHSVVGIVNISILQMRKQAWGSNVICPRSHNLLVVELGFESFGFHWLHCKLFTCGAVARTV